MASQYPVPDSHNHRRTKSSVLSFMHKRTPSGGAGLSSNLPKNFVGLPAYQSVSHLPQDHQCMRALGELQQNQQSQPPLSPKKSREAQRPNTSEDGSKSLHKKTMSAISLKSLGKDAERKSKEPKPNKKKSTTNLANLLSRPKSSKNLRKQAEEDARAQKDKENRTPTSTSSTETTRPPPIYAQFSSEYFAKQPLGGKFLEGQIDLYTPQDNGRQRDFHAGPDGPPSLGVPGGEFQRPKSTYLPSNFSLQDITRKVSGGSRHSAEIIRRVSGGKRLSFEMTTTASSAKSDNIKKPLPQKGHRMKPSTSSTDKKSSPRPVESGPVVPDKDVDREFEAMLDRRNIPEHQRGKMRSLAMSMKKDFIRQDWAELAAAQDGTPGTSRSNSSAEATNGTQDVPELKTKRPRSRTFTLSRASSKEPTSPSKKSKDEKSFTKSKKSWENLKDGNKSLTASGAAVAQTLIAKAKGQLTDDFVSYLRKFRKPELVEVGKLHKLRLLLRNETVAWTDGFIGQGGMDEIVGLLHRTMEVEWREEHEDALLHEVLLCLKALSTTALALQHLDRIQVTLFPALLHMLFDEEKKGPSEFTTRNIITSLLFTYLKFAPISERTHRARVLLSYLRDPEPSESQRPVGFVLEMRRPRPYRVWCKEVVNVTKEVFWIFLHNLNVVALPKATTNHGDHSRPQGAPATSDNALNSANPHHVYMNQHFPKERPPVPAAPYVGGVEWEATNYLSSHLDIINGIIASLPTQVERNTLREKMLVSGWEKCLGGTLRLCKEKFYGGIHDGLRCWVAAACDDGWDTRDVRCGTSVESTKTSPKKSPKKNAPVEDAPKIEMKLDFLSGAQQINSPLNDDVWL